MSDKLEALRLEAETLSGLMMQLAENEIDSDSFAVMSDLGENGQEHDCDLPITETALRASAVIDQLLAALEEKDQSTAELNVKLFDQSVLLDAAISRAEAAEQREGNLKSDFDVLSARNAELEQRLANAEHQLYMKDLAIINIRSSRLAQFRKRKEAEQREDRYRQRWVDAVADLDVAGKRNAELEQRLDTDVREWTQKYVNEKSRAEQLGKSLDEANLAGQGWMERAKAAEAALAVREAQSGWTNNHKADAALVMLDRIETTGFVDDDRIDEVKRLIRQIAAQPAPAQPLEVTDEMAMAFHRALTDSDIGSDDLDDIKIGLRGALCNYIAPPAPAVPDFGALTKLIVGRLIDCGTANDDSIADAEVFVYNACRAAMLAAAPINNPNSF
ncbi:hypothetical protein [Serratia fonticola]